MASSPASCTGSVSTLDALRADIDRIDDALLALVEERLAASAAIAAGKDAAGDARLKLRPRREAAVIARLAKRASHAPPALIEEIWRALMAHGLQAQAPTRFLVCGTDALRIMSAIGRRYGAAAPISHVGTAEEALAAARTEEAVAVIACDLAPILTADDTLRMFETLRDPKGQPIALAIGRVAAEDALP